jgi:hypothetical protein
MAEAGGLDPHEGLPLAGNRPVHLLDQQRLLEVVDDRGRHRRDGASRLRLENLSRHGSPPGVDDTLSVAGTPRRRVGETTHRPCGRIPIPSARR